MKLYFVRHGVAVEADAWNGDDASRPLTDDGKKSMEREAKALAKIDLQIDRVLTSPFKRAKQTAKIVAKRLNVPLVEDERLASGFDAAKLEEIVRDNDGAPSLLLVGHEPDFSEVVCDLTGARINLKKGGIACVEDGHLSLLLTPRVLLAL
jgi:phosphohistidine phosphatase